MNDINLIDSCQAHPCNTLRTSISLARSDTGVVIDSEPHLSYTCEISLLCYVPGVTRNKCRKPKFCYLESQQKALLKFNKIY